LGTNFETGILTKPDLTYTQAQQIAEGMARKNTQLTKGLVQQPSPLVTDMGRRRTQHVSQLWKDWTLGMMLQI
jgi:hypothetical protein